MTKLCASATLLLSCLLGLQQVRAQTPGDLTASDRLQSLERTVQGMSRRLDELSRLLQRLLPPSPIEDVTPFDVTISQAATKGSARAGIAVVEFADFRCPFCARHARTVYPEIARQYIDTGKILYAFRHLPLEQLHASAMSEAESAECAREQGAFWQMHDWLFSQQKAPGPSDLHSAVGALGLDQAAFDDCLTNHRTAPTIKADVADAGRFGLTGTPAFYLGGGEPAGV